MSPAGQALRRTGLSPDQLTAAGIALSIPAAWAIATGRLILGLVLLIASALPDLFDGSLAKASGRTSQRGAFFDSVGDRVSDTFVLVGFAWYVQDRFGGHAALVPMAVLGASQLVSYIRAKGDALGIDAQTGLMERGERIVVLCFALLFSFDDAVAALGHLRPFSHYRGPAVREGMATGQQAPGAAARRADRCRAALAGLEGGEGRARSVLVGQAPRGPGASTSGFFSGSRRPGSGAGGGRWHERRVERRKRHLQGRDYGGGEPSTPVDLTDVDLTGKVPTRRHSSPGQG